MTWYKNILKEFVIISVPITNQVYFMIRCYNQVTSNKCPLPICKLNGLVVVTLNIGSLKYISWYI
jgi:hypothetical protein